MSLEVTQLVKSEGPFNYFHLKATTGDCVEGEIILNNSTIYSFKNGGSEITLNEIQDRINSGKNTLTIKIHSKEIAKNDKCFSKNPICLKLYASNKEKLPQKDDEILCINWPPKKSGKNEEVHYLFVVRTPKKKTLRKVNNELLESGRIKL